MSKITVQRDGTHFIFYCISDRWDFVLFWQCRRTISIFPPPTFTDQNRWRNNTEERHNSCQTHKYHERWEQLWKAVKFTARIDLSWFVFSLTTFRKWFLFIGTSEVIKTKSFSVSWIIYLLIHRQINKKFCQGYQLHQRLFNSYSLKSIINFLNSNIQHDNAEF